MSFKDGIVPDPECGIWGIYDGHLGAGVAIMVKQEMVNIFEQIYKEGEWKDKPQLTEEFFKQVFLTVNDLADTSNIPEAGACVSIVVVRSEDHKKICYTANVGDSSVYILNKTNEDSSKLSYDHHT